MSPYRSLLFPHDKVREIQDQLILKVSDVVDKGQNLIVHAPTGLGKTAATLAPALKHSLDKKKTVFFLTSRHTQHKIAIDTLLEIKEKHEVKFNAVDIIGKKWLCLQPGVTISRSMEFAEYCRALKEDKACDFYENLKKKDSFSAASKRVLEKLHAYNPVTTEKIMELCEQEKVCPYEISLALAKDSNVIVTDYYYIFSPQIRDIFLKKTNKSLQDAIVIVDEAHNLPARIKDLATARMSTLTINRAISEASKYKHDDLVPILEKIRGILINYSTEVDNTTLKEFASADAVKSGEIRYENEIYVKKEDFVNKIKKIKDYEELVSELSLIGDKIREEQKYSYIGAVAVFLEAWQGSELGFTRILGAREGLKEKVITLSYRCLDPSIVAKEVIDNAYSVILMSGTLTPTNMFRELMGFVDAEEAEYKSPFPEKNKLNIIIPRTSTKYTARSESQYKQIAEYCAKAINAIPGNSIVFFPSYKLRDDIFKYLNDLCEKTMLLERRNMTKKDKEDVLERFKEYQKTGAVLLGVISGNFGEGIDLPGDELKGVVVVGLPLQKPDLETKALIDYYDKKFGKGWDYGYLFPAFNKALQSAGRCIRSETDKGVMIFLDERYTWKNYFRLFPPHWNMKITILFEHMIKDFFGGEDSH
ncbi:MAG: ATP-dependent DNA helicase [archaeon]